MSARRYDPPVIELGADWGFSMTVTSDAYPTLVGCTFALQLRAFPASTSTVIAELTTANGRITVNGLVISLVLPRAVVNLLTPGVYAYDFFCTTASATNRWLEGRIPVVRRVTVVA